MHSLAYKICIDVIDFKGSSVANVIKI